MGVEVFELIDIFMLYLIGKNCDYKNIGQYRDNGLAKQLQSSFKQKGLQKIIVYNFKVKNYLDVTFNLNDDSYQLYRKPNHETH